MRKIITLWFCFFIFHHLFAQQMPDKKYSYLALGDSYTIGEGVQPEDNYPNQAIRILNKSTPLFQQPRIVAKTGWTTDELEEAIANAELKENFDFVSLLIGVNNQYRGRSIEEYSEEFEKLLNQALQFAGKKTDHVFVISIPDWSVTPFAKEKHPELITKEIDNFNAVNKKIADKYKVRYIEITIESREAAKDETLIISDRLHPSGKEYAKWATKLADAIYEKIQ